MAERFRCGYRPLSAFVVLLSPIFIGLLQLDALAQVDHKSGTAWYHSSLFPVQKRFHNLGMMHADVWSRGTYVKDHVALDVIKPKLPPTFDFQPIVPPTVSRLPVLAITPAGAPIFAISPEIITNHEVVLANSPAAIAIIAQGQDGIPPSIAEALTTFLLMGAGNARRVLDIQAALLSSLAGILGSLPQVPSPVRVPSIPTSSSALQILDSIVASGPTLLEDLAALGTLAEVRVAAGLISEAERDVVISNLQNYETMVRLITTGAQRSLDVAAALNAVPTPTPVKVKIDTTVGSLVELSGLDVLNNLGSDIATNVQVLPNDATITNPGMDGVEGLVDSGDQSLLGGILQPLLQGIQGRGAKTEGSQHLAQAVTATGPLSLSEIRQLIELNDHLEFLSNHLQQQSPLQPHSYRQEPVPWSSRNHLHYQQPIQPGNLPHSSPALYSTFGYPSLRSDANVR